jgi:hypothetical protein
VKDEVTALTLEDKLHLQLDNKKQYDDWQMIHLVEDLPNVHTAAVVEIIKDK